MNTLHSAFPAEAQLKPEIARRRTFAIISHPDAGKTTLTEKLLLFGGAIHLAGEVAARGERRRTRSDWMDIEKKRGISVSSSVMMFERDGIVYNLLDTPGHEDFSEDTYRTLTAVDSAVMVVDAAKGIEAQTLKLFEVCRLRDIPIITFINKVDREGRDPFELMDEIADKLALELAPVTWPVGMGGQFHGVYNLTTNDFHRVKEGGGTGYGSTVKMSGVNDPKLDEMVEASVLEEFRIQAELAQTAMPAVDAADYREGHLSPVVFGSALRDFCVADLLDGLHAWAPPPRPQPAGDKKIDPNTNEVSALIFKVQANMDPNHRDRIAFARICSGRFQRGMKLNQAGSGKTLAVTAPIFFLAEERELAEEAWAGDIIGIPNHGALRVGDTLSEKGDIRFTGLPRFAPEILRRVRLGDPMKTKQLRRALQDLSEEGLAQVFRTHMGGDHIVGVVGALQLDVMASRVAAEYKVAIDFEAAPYATARWLLGDERAVKNFVDVNKSTVADDVDGDPVYLARNGWELNYTREKYPDVKFVETKEMR
ncbi:peptide chain release factor 3 [Acuticoccus sp. MNP-M23]|uniref:peptide chain release factor 3 n=1 Tax=Acuticoccus sp. MNP-M23 TaxID=3072793 RepID=UPI002815B001|nr:peptide chain release factor 3 [Acuticoccus sp. MNP-M23]WMS41760.1 peptide chain release factor 3 [Acuticoccus sp. MNP-M23]